MVDVKSFLEVEEKMYENADDETLDEYMELVDPDARIEFVGNWKQEHMPCNFTMIQRALGMLFEDDEVDEIIKMIFIGATTADDVNECDDCIGWLNEDYFEEVH